MYTHLLEVFIPAQRGYRHPARKPNVARLTNLVTENSMVFEFRHDPDDLYEKLPIERSSTLYIYNRRVVSEDMPIPDCVWPVEQTLWQRAMDMNYSHVQLRTLQALGFAQKKNGDYYTEKYRGPQVRGIWNHVRVTSNEEGLLQFWTRFDKDSTWKEVEGGIALENIPNFILKGE